MQSAEPDEPHFVSDPCQAAATDEAWRAEVASRVSSYRARRRRRSGSDSPALDFGPVGDVQDRVVPDFTAQGLLPRQTQAPATKGAAPEAFASAEPRSSAQPARNAFDTNYYRRMNAESLNTGSALRASGALLDATAGATVQYLESEEAVFETVQQENCEEKAIDLELRSSAAGDPCLDRYCISEAEPALIEEPLQESKPEAAPQAQGNLIVFRRPLLEPPLAPQPSRDELAEPMYNRPRILEVPEDIMPAVQGSLFPEIRLDGDEQESSHHREPEIEVPLPVALISDRFLASLVDMGVVTTAGLLFGGIAWFALPGVPHAKTFFMVLGAVNLALWAVYQHLFLLYAGRTLGMSMRGIRLSTFDGHTPAWKQRGSRARFMFISLASVMLGFLWAMVDEDMLCWHDRISQTFPTTG